MNMQHYVNQHYYCSECFIVMWGAVVARKSAGLSIEGTVVQSHLPPFRNLGNFVTLHSPVSFGRDTKSWWSLLSGVCQGK